jgi:hypothetical protein
VKCLVTGILTFEIRTSYKIQPMCALAKSFVLKIANDICILFHESVRNEVAKATRSGRIMPTRELDEVDASARKAFMAASRACIELEADAREYIVAQFAMWREASAYHKKLLLPSPQHLGTLAARVRYLQYKARDEVRSSRVSDADEQDDSTRWYVEERKLKGLARTQRRDPVDILTEQPEQFTMAFLEHKRVWDVVSDLWEERRR